MQLISKEIRAEAEFSDGYRFRVWRTLWEDSAILGMGSRSYHSHIINVLELARKAGYQLLNPKGDDANLGALTVNDLKWFLGKKTDRARGPSGRLGNPKFWVLDLYIKRQLPHVTAFEELEKGRRSFALAATSFFPEIDYESTGIAHTSKHVDGIFVPTLEMDERFEFPEDYQFDPNELSIPVYFLYFEQRSKVFKKTPKYCSFELALFPVNEARLSTDVDPRINRKLSNYRDLKGKYGFDDVRPIHRYSGFCLFSNASNINRIQLQAMGMHCTNYTPFCTQLSIRNFGRGYSEMEEAKPRYSEYYPSHDKFRGEKGNTTYFKYERSGNITDIYSKLFEEEVLLYYNNILGVC